jgi:hypothetical protein
MFGATGYYSGGDDGAHGSQDRRNSAGGAFDAGNSTFGGGRSGGFQNGFANHCIRSNNHQDGFQSGHGQQCGADLLPPDGFGPRRNTYGSQEDGRLPNGYTNGNSYREQNFADDFGGVACGRNGGALGHGLGGGGSDSVYLQGTNHFNTRRF